MNLKVAGIVSLTLRDVNALGAVAVEGLPVRPGLLVRVPVAGFNVVDAIVGLTLDVPLR